MSEDDVFDELPPRVRLCACGCSEDEHDPSGICHFCGPDDCGGFTYDEESTILALTVPEELL